jgi:hypothetical protein
MRVRKGWFWGAIPDASKAVTCLAAAVAARMRHYCFCLQGMPCIPATWLCCRCAGYRAISAYTSM